MFWCMNVLFLENFCEIEKSLKIRGRLILSKLEGHWLIKDNYFTNHI